MPDFSQRSYKKELLDQDDIPFAAIRQNMQELNFINTWLGGHHITVKGIRKILSFIPDLSKRTEISICEIGCGGGDNLYAISKWCKKNKIRATFTGVDINPACIAFAQSNSQLQNVVWITGDYKKIEFAKNPDIIFSSLFCHHFTDTELTKMLGWMKSQSNDGFFINDLHRHPVAYYFISWLTKLFSKSYLVKHDAPLSVARALVKKEWNALFGKAGIKNYTIRWEWAFRWLIICTN